jgi:hypothetical protein
MPSLPMTIIVMSNGPSLRSRVGAARFQSFGGGPLQLHGYPPRDDEGIPRLTQFMTSPNYQNARKQPARLEGMVKYDYRADGRTH